MISVNPTQNKNILSSKNYILGWNPESKSSIVSYWHKHKLSESRSLSFESAFSLVNVFGCNDDKIAVEYNSSGPKNILEVIQVIRMLDIFKLMSPYL